ncbi:hypothetical protein ABKN59_008111 [Abortiporus biennis]
MSDLSEIARETSFINYTQLSANLLCFYDLLITFDMEMQSTRMLLLLDLIPRAALACNVGFILPGVVDVIGFTATAVFSALRVLAIWGYYNRFAQFLCFIILAVGLTTPSFNIYRMTVIYSLSDQIQLPHMSLCEVVSNISPGKARTGKLISEALVALLTRSFALLCEVIVLLATWAKTYTIWKESRSIGFHAPITTLLLRDGTVYFGFMVMINIIAVVLNVIHSPDSNEATTYFTSFSSILISRMMLNLREGTSTSSSAMMNQFNRTSLILVSNGSPPALAQDDVTTIIFGHIGMPISYTRHESDSESTSDGDMELIDREQIVGNPLSMGLIPPVTTGYDLEAAETQGTKMS